MIRNILFYFLLSFSTISYCNAQQQSLDWVNEHAVATDDGKKYLSMLATQLKDNIIIGLGEASHGTHEFSVEKSRIVNYLISHQDYRAIGFESAYAVMERVNKFTSFGVGDLKEIMKPLRLFDTKELYDLFQSIKTYNADKSPNNKITVFGFDIDYAKADVDSSARYCLSYLVKNPNQYAHANSIIPILNKIKAADFANLYEMSDEEIAAIADLRNEVNVKVQVGSVEFSKFKKHLSLIYQGTLVTNPLARDEFMAENIAATQQASKDKTILWSHNVHIAKDTTMAMCKGMGYYLKKQYGDKYYAVAFDTYKGATNSIVNDGFQANSFEMQPTSLSALFAKAKYSHFFINVDTTRGNPLYNKRNYITNIFSNWGNMRTLQIKPGIDFNSLIFLRETTASTELK